MKHLLTEDAHDGDIDATITDFGATRECFKRGHDD